MTIPCCPLTSRVSYLFGVPWLFNIVTNICPCHFHGLKHFGILHGQNSDCRGWRVNGTMKLPAQDFAKRMTQICDEWLLGPVRVNPNTSINLENFWRIHLREIRWQVYTFNQSISEYFNDDISWLTLRRSPKVIEKQSRLPPCVVRFVIVRKRNMPCRCDARLSLPVINRVVFKERAGGWWSWQFWTVSHRPHFSECCHEGNHSSWGAWMETAFKTVWMETRQMSEATQTLLTLRVENSELLYHTVPNYPNIFCMEPWFFKGGFSAACWDARSQFTKLKRSGCPLAS